MDTTRHLQILRAEGSRLAAMPASALDAPVPSVEGWTLERVVRHTAKVHRWATAVLDAGPQADIAALGRQAPSSPSGPACLPAYREALDALVAELGRHDPSEPAASFAGPVTTAFWARRQANEVAVHRVDAADAVHAAGGPPPEPLPADLAADGIDEWARFYLALYWPQRFGSFPDDLVGRSVHLHGTDEPATAGGTDEPATAGGTDGPAEWLLAVGTDGVEVTRRHAKGDVALRGPAQDLLLTLWRRRALGSADVDVEVVGDEVVAQRLLEVATF